MPLSDEELRQLAGQAEKGLSEQDLTHTRQGPGPGILDLLPGYMIEAVRACAATDGTSETTIMRNALQDYLDRRTA